MKLLICTQVVDQDDLYLGFFHAWIDKLAAHFDHIEVICLYEGQHQLPANVTVHSLGKEQGRTSRLRYLLRFLYLVWQQRNQYDRVLVHMNQEYVLMAGWLWLMLGKKIYMWRNHYAGSALTDAAAAFCTNVFCTSKFSYTAKYRKTIFMPVGVDTGLYKPTGAPRAAHSVLFYARFSPSKRPEVLLEALEILQRRGVEFTASFFGTPLPKDEAFAAAIKHRAGPLGDRVHFAPGKKPRESAAVFSTHEVYVDPSRSGMFNKMLFEAAACGALVLASSRDWVALAGEEFGFAEGNAVMLADKLEALLKLKEADRQAAHGASAAIVERHSLGVLGVTLSQALMQS